MTGILEDDEALLTIPTTTERVGDVGQTVLVERAGHERRDGEGERRTHRGRQHLGGQREDTTTDEPDQQPDDGEPRRRSRDVDLTVTMQRHPSQERSRDAGAAHRAVPARHCNSS